MRCLHEKLVAAPDAASAARRVLGGFLAHVGWSHEGRESLLLAVSEAVTNAAQHAYPDDHPGTITLMAHVVVDRHCAHRVWVCVTDHGRWRPQPAQNPGWGLRLMRATTAHLAIDTIEGGTRITMISDTDTRRGSPTRHPGGNVGQLGR